MREILFRGKTYDTNEWVEGCYLQSVVCKDVYGYIMRDNSRKLDTILLSTIGQYTGLTDKNGKKIFTKDIVAITALGNDHYQKGVKTIAVIEDYMGNTCLCIDGKHQTGTTLYDIIITHTVEVIGNAIDNPELLKGGENG